MSKAGRDSPSDNKNAWGDPHYMSRAQVNAALVHVQEEAKSLFVSNYAQANKIDEQKAEIDALRNEVSGLRAYVAEHENGSDMRQPGQAVLQSDPPACVWARLKQLEIQVDTLEEAAIVKNGHIEDLQGNYNALQAKHHDLQNKYQDLKDDHNTLQDDNKMLRSDNSTLQNNKNALQNDKNALQDAMKKLQKTHQASQKNVALKDKQLAEERARIQILEEELKRMG